MIGRRQTLVDTRCVLTSRLFIRSCECAMFSLHRLDRKNALDTGILLRHRKGAVVRMQYYGGGHEANSARNQRG